MTVSTPNPHPSSVGNCSPSFTNQGCSQGQAGLHVPGPCQEDKERGVGEEGVGGLSFLSGVDVRGCLQVPMTQP